ncbi:MAG: hypothetical protein HC838_12780, partial [Spirulinaceae cyanobacterium RM2_2_10]|nr:hypothetical protein [Spirulinaceae cyanobacterium RM2_2_10]
MLNLKHVTTLIASLAIASGSSYLGYAAASRYLPSPSSTSQAAVPDATTVVAPAPGETLVIPATTALPAKITVQTAQAVPDNDVTVQIFQADSTCEALVAEAVAVPADDALNVAINRTWSAALAMIS